MEDKAHEDLKNDIRLLSINLERIESILINQLIKHKNMLNEREKLYSLLQKTTLINNAISDIQSHL
jgi:hypothetical protein